MLLTAYLIIAAIVALTFFFRVMSDVGDDGVVIAMVISPLFAMGSLMVGALWPLTAPVGVIAYLRR